MREYSDSPPHSSSRPHADPGPLTLALDSGSPQVSLALGHGARVIAETSFPGGPSSPSLLGQLEALLASIGGEIRDIERMIGAQGPGSFTGLRGGLASLLGLSQALDIQATAVPSFLPLAAQASTTGRVVAAVDALRGEWFVQVFESPTGDRVSEPAILSPADIATWAPCSIIAFGSRKLGDMLATQEHVTVQEARPLAPELLRLACDERLHWSVAALTSPLYLRPPAPLDSKPGQPGL